MLFKELVQKLRCQLALSQGELADLLKTNQTSVSFYERGTRKPTLKTIRKFVDQAKQNGINVEYSDFMS